MSRPRSQTPSASLTDEELAVVSCAGKEAFASFDLARTVSSRMRRRRGTSLQPYRCRFCDRWHLGGPR